MVIVLENCQISPPSGSISNSRIPLSFFDVKYIHLPPISTLFFYEFNRSKHHFTNIILPNIKHSLSITLPFFFPLAGNLTWPEDSVSPYILCTDGDSISFTVCKSEADFVYLSDNNVKERDETYPLVPQLFNPSDPNHRPLFALQVTLFPDKGYCIGTSYNHTVADGKMFIQFMRSWATVCKLQGDASFLSKSLICHDRLLVKDTHGTAARLLDSFKRKNITSNTFNASSNNHMVPADKILATFILSSPEILRLKKWVLNALEEPLLRLSTFVVVSAYIWVCSIRATVVGEDEEVDPMEYFMFPVEVRAWLDPPLPDYYFGNCLVGGVVKSKRSDLTGEHGISIASKLIAEEMQNMDIQKRITEDHEKITSAPERVANIAGSPKFGIYEIDFGWGNPKKVDFLSIVNFPIKTVFICECPNEIGAVQVSVARKRNEMDHFSSLFRKTIKGIVQNPVKKHRSSRL